MLLLPGKYLCCSTKMEEARIDDVLELLRKSKFAADGLHQIINEANAQLAQTKSSSKVEAQKRDEQGQGGDQAKPPPAQADRQSGQATTAADRKMSVAGSSNPEQEKEFLERLLAGSALKALGWEGWNIENVMELVELFDGVISNSGGDVDDAVSKWYDASVPTQGMTEKAREGQRQFLIEIAKRSRTAKKMARIGVAVKTFMTLVFGYADVVTDLLVAKSYYDAGEIGTAQTTAGFAILAILVQALMTFFQYAKKPWKEQVGRTLAALFGLGPLIEGLSVWTGKEDSDLLLSGPQMYACMKGFEIAFESIPECIIQLRALFKAKADDIQTIQIIGVISSIVSGAFIMTDGNFGLTLSKYLAIPGDPIYGWISKNGGWEKRRQMFGMFLFNACYFSQFVFSMSLVAQAFGSMGPLFILLGVEYCAVCAYIGYKGELFGWAMVSQPSTFNSYIHPFICWAFYYLLVSAVPMLIAAAPMELGPEVFAGIMVWRLLTNGGIIYVALGELGGGHYFGLTTGMLGYAVSLGLAAIGLALFFMNCDENFDRSLFWRRKSGKQHARDCWKDKKIWSKKRKTKEDDIWGWVENIHPTYLPFDMLTTWICETLVGKCEDKKVERPEWMSGEEAEDKFMKRIAEVYEWYGKDGEEVNEALDKLFERSGRDLEKGIDGQPTFIKIKGSKSKSGKVEGEGGKRSKVAPAID
ncbi:hypothetical protein TrVE_jg3836 [Triparma verrucosa]|uniref:Uncharacterized protein n=1 Tax=Triparma verrucosa TaxID=1606542 RepID=A0A9W7CGI8_9STRA|nr:hypothetical protein TrVE_jg3836 [Triparma verrucosa]